MEWTKKIGSIAGIPIKIHMTMLVLAIWLLFVGKNGVAEQLSELISLIALFGSVALHELGHALTAKYLGIRTRDITLYPFGGVASLLDKINPKQELLITVAGPLVNVIIASSILIAVGSEKIIETSFLSSPIGILFSINTCLAIFNALPAFPMDGGRILRASLQLLGISSATQIAARCGQAICIGFAIIAFIYSHPILLVVAAVVFYSASKELVLNDANSKSGNLTAAEVMIPLESMQQFSPSLTLEAAAKKTLRSLQSHFPVCIEARILGLVDRETVLQKACNSIDHQYITEIMLREIPCCTAETLLKDLMGIFEQEQISALLVGSSDKCQGIVFREQLNDLLLVNEMFRQNLAQRELEQELGGP